MKLINYFGEEFERENTLTDRDLDMLKDTIEIYIAMSSKSDIDKILKTLTKEEATLVCRSASKSYVLDRMRYGY
jgi:hypothetical protein